MEEQSKPRNKAVYPPAAQPLLRHHGAAMPEQAVLIERLTAWWEQQKGENG